MANGTVQQQVSTAYLSSFNLPIGVSGMQKLQSFTALQQLGYAGQLSFMKSDFHGLKDFYSQLATYSSVNGILQTAWQLIQPIVPNNANIQLELFTSPSLGTVGLAFQTITGFGQVFALDPTFLSSPADVSAAVSIYLNSSLQASVITPNSSSAISVAGGASITTPSNANKINGVLVVGMPTAVNDTLEYNGQTNTLNWVPASQGGGSGSTSGYLVDFWS
jgi:hypothetical protein